MFTRYVVFLLAALTECAALGAPRFRMVLDLEGKYRTPTQTPSSTNQLGQYFGADLDESPLGNGEDALPFFFNGSEKIRVGLYGEQYTRPNGRITIDLDSHNQVGQATGKTLSYSNGIISGYHAWYFDGASTRQIGLLSQETFPENIHADDIPRLPIGHTGYVAGITHLSDKILHADIGTRTWVFDGAQTREAGLPKALFSNNPAGSFYTLPSHITSTGKVFGVSSQDWSTILNPVSNAEFIPWVFDGQTTREIGLSDSEYIGPNGARFGYPNFVSAVGHAFGTATRFVGNEPGVSLWYYDGAATQRIGIRDTEYTRNDGFQSSKFERPSTNREFLVGSSNRYSDGDQDLGKTLWLFDGAKTTSIGLFDAAHTRENGYRKNEVALVSDTGFVTGYATDYSALSEGSRTAWIYNPNTKQTEIIPFPSDDGKPLHSVLRTLGNDGSVLGFYGYADPIWPHEFRHFYFSPADGFHDLGSLVVGGTLFDSNFASTFLVNDAGIIHGKDAWDLYGSTPEGMGDVVLIPIPEPSTLALTAIVLTLLLRRSRRSPD